MSHRVFELDKQTQADLAIFPDSNGNKAIMDIFNCATTIGGREKLRTLFANPLTNAEQIEQRLNAIKYLQQIDFNFGIDKRECDYIEFYLTQPSKPTSFSKIKAFEKKVMYFFTGDNDFYTISKGIRDTLNLLRSLDAVAKNLDTEVLPKLLRDFCLIIKDTLAHSDFAFILQLFDKKNLTAIDIARADHLFRYLGFNRLKGLIDVVYQLDVFISVAKLTKTHQFCFPVINKSAERVLKLSGVFHPFINNAVPNDIEFNYDTNVCFLTGANMAGKSTLLKSVGVSVFLSQIGFPVPARFMETSVFDGLITTINLADNIQQGSSHFYAEVSRVKHIAQKMAQSQNMLVIFDELFRGTNVKDAFDASLAIISAFAKLRNCFFIISTHIVEVATELSAIENINFKFMGTNFHKNVPSYSYKLRDGITKERLGMWIVTDAGIVELIEGIVKRGFD